MVKLRVVPSTLPLGWLTVVIDSGSAHVLERQARGDELGGVELDAHGRLLLAADRDLADAVELADLLGELGVGVVVDLGQRQRVGGRPTGS